LRGNNIGIEGLDEIDDIFDAKNLPKTTHSHGQFSKNNLTDINLLKKENPAVTPAD
jgi:hypothetical protein